MARAGALHHTMTPLSSTLLCPRTRLGFAHAWTATAPDLFFRNGVARIAQGASGVVTCAVGVPAKNWTAGPNTPKEWQWTPHREPRRPGEKRRKIPMPRPKKERVLLRPPLDDTRLAEKLLNSPQLTLNSFPLLSACLPPAPLNEWDKAWMEEFMLEAKDALGLASFEPEEGSPGAQLDTLLYLAFQHPESDRGRRAPYVRNGHTRLAFLGEYVLELAMTELVLQMFPRELTGSLRERVFGMTSKKVLPSWLKAASMDRLIYPDGDWDSVKWNDKVKPCK
jgi:dsRNA-specific ribonuclease